MISNLSTYTNSTRDSQVGYHEPREQIKNIIIGGIIVYNSHVIAIFTPNLS